jgi:hypothetical protein
MNGELTEKEVFDLNDDRESLLDEFELLEESADPFERRKTEVGSGLLQAGSYYSSKSCPPLALGLYGGSLVFSGLADSVDKCSGFQTYFF